MKPPQPALVPAGCPRKGNAVWQGPNGATTALKLLSQNVSARRDLIISGSVPKTILMLSLPTLLMGIVQSLLPVIDGLYINNLAGTAAASAVTFCVPISGMIVGLAQGLGSAGMAMIGQANGRRAYSEGRRIAVQLIVFSTALGIGLAPVLYGLAYPISAAVDAEISANVFQYLTWSALLIPFSFLEAIYNALKNAEGKPEAAFIRMMLLLVLKIGFNALFLAVFRWGIVGAVMASLAANVLITGWMYVELFVHRGESRLSLKGFRFDAGTIRDLVRIGAPSMLSNLILYLGFYLINNEVQKYGADVLNGQGIANNISQVCFNLPAAFGAAVTTMVSMNVGAGRGERARTVTWVGCLMSAITAALLIAIIVPTSPFLTVLFTREAPVLDVANKALHIYTYSVVGFGVCMTQLGAFIGLGRTRITLVASILRVWLLRYVFILLTEHYLGVYSVFWGNLFSNYAAAAITTVMVLRVHWQAVQPLTSRLSHPLRTQQKHAA
jgi:putative MATE family efflux protein